MINLKLFHKLLIFTVSFIMPLSNIGNISVDLDRNSLKNSEQNIDNNINNKSLLINLVVENDENSNNQDITTYDVLIEGNHGIEWYITADRTLYLEGGILERSPYPWREFSEFIEKIVIKDVVELPSNSSSMFYNFKALKSIENLDFFDTSKVEYMGGMFSGTINLESIDLTNFDTSNVISMSEMFRDTPKLKNIDLSKFDTSKVKNMERMFQNSGKASMDDIENWNVSSVESISQMFEFTQFDRIDLSNWNTQNLRYMGSLFSKNQNLISVNLSNWNVKNVTSTRTLFYWNSSLRYINLSNWKISLTTNLNDIFKADLLNHFIVDELDLSNWDNTIIIKRNFLDDINIRYKLNINGWKDNLYVDEIIEKFYPSMRMPYDYFEIDGLGFKVVEMSTLDFSEIPSFTYNQKEHHPDISIKYQDYELQKDVDYIISGISNNTEAGQSYIYIQGNGYNNRIKFIDEKTLTFNIEKAKAEIVELPVATEVERGSHISNSNLIGGKVTGIDNEKLDIQFYWDYNNIDFQEVDKNGYYPINYTFQNSSYNNYDININEPLLVKVLIGFEDIDKSNSFYDYIYDLYKDEIINGYSDNTFRPNNQLTRAQAAKMIVDAAGISTKNVNSNFSDVNKNNNFYKYISAAYESGIISGYNDGTFKPNAPVTRRQISKMVTEAFELKAKGDPIKFKDTQHLQTNILKYIDIVSSNGVVSGYKVDNTFRPNNNVTRGQFSKMVSIAKDIGKK